MNLLDACIIGLLATALWFGLHRPLIRQVLITVVTIVSLAIVTVAYSRLAFLTEQSGVRALVLVLLVFAVGFLLYDMLLSAAAHFGLKKKHLKHISWQGVCSAVLAAVTVSVAAWPTSAILSTSRLPYIGQQTQSSFILTSLNQAGTVPQIFTEIAHIIEPFSSPQVFAGSEPLFQSSDGAIASDQFSQLDTTTSKARNSILKVQSWGCGSTSVGSGILVRNSIIVTNAHVVMGATRVSVQNSEGTYAARVISFDPQRDIAVLQTTKVFEAAPLAFTAKRYPAGSVGATLGYPGGSLAISDAILLKELAAEGLDIYGTQKIVREIYVVRGSVSPGSSGGALLAADGAVIGLVFGHSTVQNRTGYALTADQVIPAVDAAISQNQAASTGACGSA